MELPPDGVTTAGGLVTPLMTPLMPPRFDVVIACGESDNVSGRNFQLLISQTAAWVCKILYCSFVLLVVRNAEDGLAN